MLIVFLVFKYGDRGHDWRLTFDPDSRHPYGLVVMERLLEEWKDSTQLVLLEEKLSDVLPLHPEGNATYMAVGSGIYYDSSDVNALLEFAEAGNQVFISDFGFPYLLEDTLYQPPCDSFPAWHIRYEYFDTSLAIQFPDGASFEYRYVNRNRVRHNHWAAFNRIDTCGESYPLSVHQTADTLVSLASFPVGDGVVFVQTVPIAFSNYYLTQKDGQRYAERILSLFPPNNIVYWDRYQHKVATPQPNEEFSGYEPLTPRKGPLDYVLSQPSLAWSWYLLLAMALLFLLFRAKRRQRIIPVMPPLENTSLDFIQTISRLHLSQRNHRQISLQQMNSFLYFVRNQYQLNTKELDDHFVHQLQQRSEVEEGLIKKIVLIYTNISSSVGIVSEGTLIQLHQLLQQFYRECR